MSPIGQLEQLESKTSESRLGVVGEARREKKGIVNLFTCCPPCSCVCVASVYYIEMIVNVTSFDREIFDRWVSPAC